MEMKIQLVGKIDEVNLYFDPLRKNDSFIILQKDNKIKSGFLTDEVILESDAHIKWGNVASIMAGFATITDFEKIKSKIDEEK